MNKKFVSTGLFALAIACASPLNMMAQEKPIYQNQSYSFEERAADLVSRMTLEEKVYQMDTDAPAIDRLGVPAYRWWNECLHGVARSGMATIFPQSVGIAASFDEELVTRMADAVGDEARALFMNAQDYDNQGKYTGLTFFSPNVNIFRDPRWGRGQETFGEDPYLTSRLGIGFVKGLQGDGKYMKAGACAKHFAVHSGPEKLRHGFDAIASKRDMYETYLPAFKALIQEGQVESVMGAYNRTNGQLCCGSREYLVDILRDQWGFNGYVTSDCGALYNFVKDHKVCKTAVDAAALAANAGLNLNCGGVYENHLVKAVQKGLVKEATIDSLLTTLLTTRFKLGLFDPQEQVPHTKIARDIMDSKKHQDLAYEMAVKSMVLLKNDNNLLPLGRETKYVYVTGPLGNNPDALIGNYYGTSSRLVTYLEGIAGQMPKGMSIQYRQGVMLDRFGYNNWTVREAPEGDVIVACMGITNMLEGEETDAIASQEKGDMTDLSLPEAQLKFLRELRKNADKEGTKIIIVMSGGTPLVMTEVAELSDALIYAWYPGEAGGTALGDMLFGRVSPSGRTPMTFVKSIDQLPPFHDYNMEGRTYRYMKEEPLYPFGYGLSYTTFGYTNLEMPAKIKAGQPVPVKVTVTNTGQVKADEIVQCYITDVESKFPVPVRSLCGVKRVTLAPGDSKVVELTVSPEIMAVYTDKDQRIIEAGDFTISVGGGQPVKITGSYETKTVRVKGKKKLSL